MSESNKAAARRIMDIFSTGNVSVAPELISTGCVDHEGIPGMDTQGVEGFQRVVSLYRSAFPDLKADIMSIVAEDDRVFVQLE